MRLAVLAAVSCFVLSVAIASDARAFVKIATDIPEEPLDLALKTLARDRGFQVVFRSEVVRGARTNGAHGDLTIPEALNKLLDGTHLTYKYLDDNTITILGASETGAAMPPDGVAPSGDPPGQYARNEIRLAQAGQNTSGETMSSETPESDSGRAALAEVVVTAQKRAESILEVPMSLTALSGAQLQEAHEYRYEDFVATVPGLIFTEGSSLGGELSIRGISGFANAAVATYIDETPYTAVGPFSGGTFMSPDVDAFDMQRIEILRGPQGTLYGASAMGGILKYVTNAPDPTGFSAAVESGVSSVQNGGIGDSVHGMVNVPLSSIAALRVVGYDNYYPGYIDDPSRGLTDINSSRYAGGRASLLVEPTSTFSVRLTALYQERSFNDYSNGEDVAFGTLQPLYGNLTQERLIRQPGNAVTQLYNATVNWDFSLATLLSTTSYSRYQTHVIYDGTAGFGPTVSAVVGSPVGAAITFTRPQDSITQEVRLASAGDSALKWHIGGFFTNQNEWEGENFLPIDLTMKSVEFSYPTTILEGTLDSHYREYAAFADLDYAILPTVEIGVGGRFSHNEQTFSELEQIPAFGIERFIANDASEHVGTYSADIKWHFLPRNMLYGRVASGYIPGGPNDIVPNGTLPSSFASSSATNYEVGIKSQALDDRLTAEVSAFLIDWKKIQLIATVDGFGQVTNGGSARSEGFEWQFTYLPISQLTLGLNGAYTDAKLKDNAPSSNCEDPTANTPCLGLAGNRLPNVPLWATDASAEFRQPFTGAYTGVVGLDWRFVGQRLSDFADSPANDNDSQSLPSYKIVNLRGGVESKAWSFSLYAKNLNNARAISTINAPGAPIGPQSAILITPRTIGATISVKF